MQANSSTSVDSQITRISLVPKYHFLPRLPKLQMSVAFPFLLDIVALKTKTENLKFSLKRDYKQRYAQKYKTELE